MSTAKVVPSGNCAMVRFDKQQHQFDDFLLYYDAWYFRDEGAESSYVYMLPVELVEKAVAAGGRVMGDETDEHEPSQGLLFGDL